MAYFDGEKLKYKTGEEVMKTAEELKRACLSYRGFKLRISEIIFEMVGNLINEKIQQNGPNKNYGQSELYCKLEKAIQNDPVYLERKRKFQQNYKVVAENKKIYQKEETNFYGTKSAKKREYSKTYRQGRPSSGLGFYPDQRY